MKPIHYKCRKCGEINEITSFWKWFWTPHIGASKHMRCSGCGKFRVMSRMDGLRFIDWPSETKSKLWSDLEEAYEVIREQQRRINELGSDLDIAQREWDEADGYYCSMIDNLRDDVRELKNEKAELVSKFERIVYGTPVKDIFEDLDSEVQRDPGYESFIAYSDYEAVKKKYGVED